MDNQWLQQQFRLHPGKSKAELAQALGLDRPAVSKILAGTRQIKAAEYAAMRRFFGLPVDGERAAAGAYVLKPLGGAGREEGGLAEPAAAAPGEEAWVMPASLFAHRTKAAPGNIRLFTVRDAAMAPDLAPGETVLVDMGDLVPSPPGMFLVSDGVGHIIRQCAAVPQESPPLVKLAALNPKFESYILPAARTGIAGRVIAKLQWL